MTIEFSSFHIENLQQFHPRDLMQMVEVITRHFNYLSKHGMVYVMYANRELCKEHPELKITVKLFVYENTKQPKPIGKDFIYTCTRAKGFSYSHVDILETTEPSFVIKG